jgi:hypothetical protein
VGAKDKISIYLVNVSFSTILAFKGTIRKFLNVVAAHIEGQRYPPYAYFTHFFLGQCPFIGTLPQIFFTLTL